MTYKYIYFIGIGGIGMSAIARYYKSRACNVAGYDRTPSDLTRALEAEGIEVHYEGDCSHIPEDVENTLVIYTPAVSDDFCELSYVREKGYKVIKRSKALGEISETMSCLAVAGTHGKTTTSTLVAHILTESGKGCNAFLGGISKNYGTNLLLSPQPSVVVEADEFDRSFLQLHPAIAAITAMDADHLDIYGDIEHVHEAFRSFASQVRETLIIKHGLSIRYDDTSAKIWSYHLDNPEANFHSSNMRLLPSGHYIFDLVYPGGVIADIELGVLGWLNVENAIAAAAICLCYGVDAQKVKAAMASFQGVCRRLDVQYEQDGLIYIDDYAHHPAELHSAITSVRKIFPGRKITGIFQPHLYTRTRDFATEFAQSLSELDKLILLDIYPAREKPIEGVDSRIILKDVTCPEKVLISKKELITYLQNEEIDVLLTLGAGDIDRLVAPISSMLASR